MSGDELQSLPNRGIRDPPSHFFYTSLSANSRYTTSISLLESIYNENLKKLEVYDRDNGTDYMSFLRLYLKYDGSVL